MSLEWHHSIDYIRVPIRLFVNMSIFSVEYWHDLEIGIGQPGSLKSPVAENTRNVSYLSVVHYFQ